MIEQIEIKDEDDSGNHTPDRRHEHDWQDRSELEWALRVEVGGTILMKRIADDEGLDYRGHYQPWQDVAHFKSWADADLVYRLLTKESDPSS